MPTCSPSLACICSSLLKAASQTCCGFIARDLCGFASWNVLGESHMSAGLGMCVSRGRISLSTEGNAVVFCRWFTSQGNAVRYGSDERRDEITDEEQQSRSVEKVCDILEANPWGPVVVEALEDASIVSSNHKVRQVLRRTKCFRKYMGFVDWLKSKEFVHDRCTYGAMVTAFGEAGHLDKMKQVVDEMQKAGYRLDSYIYGNAIFWSALMGDNVGAIEFWGEMKCEKILPGAGACTTMMDIFAKEKRYNEVIEIYSEMVEKGSFPSSRTYATLIHCLLDAGKLHAAHMIFNKLPKVNAVPQMLTFAYLMFAYAMVSNTEMVKQLGKEMRCIYDRPGRIFCGAVQALHREGKIEEAEIYSQAVWPELSADDRLAKVWQSYKPLETRQASFSCVKREGCACSGENGNEYINSYLIEEKLLRIARKLRVWDISVLATLEQINTDWNDGIVHMILRTIKNSSAAWNFFLWLKSLQGFQHDVYNELTMLRLLAQNGLFNALQDLLTDMRNKGIKLSITTFNVILKESSLFNNSNAAVQVLGLMKEFGLTANEETFSALIVMFVKNQYYEQTFELWEQMQDEGFQHKADMYMFLIHSLCSAGETERAQLVFERMLESDYKPDAYIYTSLIRAHSLTNNTNMALTLYQRMKAANIAPVAATQRAMARVLYQIGKLEEAEVFEIEARYPSSTDCMEVLMYIHRSLLENLVEGEREQSLLF